MVARATEQLGLAIGTPTDPADADEQVLLVEHLVAACRAVARELTVEFCANALDEIWANRGRPVSASVLRAALNPGGVDYKHFRIEWAAWFAGRSELVAEVLLEMAGRGKPKKTPEQELEDLKQVIRSEYPKQAEKLIRKGAAPR